MTPVLDVHVMFVVLKFRRTRDDYREKSVNNLFKTIDLQEWNNITSLNTVGSC